MLAEESLVPLPTPLEERIQICNVLEPLVPVPFPDASEPLETKVAVPLVVPIPLAVAVRNLVITLEELDVPVPAPLFAVRNLVTTLTTLDVPVPVLLAVLVNVVTPL
jgi:hypothetical protein